MKNTFYPLKFGRTKRGTRGFSLVEVTLAVAVVAIGLLGILGLFPLGMDAVRQAADATQMMAIGQDSVAYFQQEAANSNFYGLSAFGVDPMNVIDPKSPFGYGSYSNNLTVDGIGYRIEAIVTNAAITVTTLSGVTWVNSLGYSTITDTNGLTNMISRIEICVYRTVTNSLPPYYRPVGNTNYFITEVARYVQ